MTKKYIISIIRALILLPFFLLTGCSDPWDDYFIIKDNGQTNNPGSRKETPETRKVLLLYSAGNNSLRNYLLDDIKDLKEGWLPGNRRSDDVLLVYTHTPVRTGNYSTPSAPHLIRLYKDSYGKVMADTLITYTEGTISSSAMQFTDVLNDMKDIFPARSYGMIFSSHATGYLPAGYYLRPNSYVFPEAAAMNRSRKALPAPVPYIEPEHDPSRPMVKSIGQDVMTESGNQVSYEMDLKDFASAIPFRLDYILFDACLMGGVEVAYELREKCDRVGFSQAEVLAEGLDYKTLTKHLLQARESDPQAVCEDYFEQYAKQSGLYRSATISMIDTKGLDELATTCKSLFNKYRISINGLSGTDVQNFGGDKIYFFDMTDVIKKAGANTEELEALQAAMDNVVAYRNTTGQYYSATDGQTHAISEFSGLTMYIPGCGNAELRKYYRTLGWNQATGLVE